MKISREVKVGIVAVVALFLLYFGMNFLKGIDIFSPVKHYYGVYANLGGLTESAPVYIKGYKVGQVDAVHYDFSARQPFVITISVNKDIALPLGTRIELFDDGLLGGKAVQLVMPDIMAATDSHHDKDTLATSTTGGLVAGLQEQLMPKLNSAIEHVDSLVVSANQLIGGDELKSSLKNVETITAELKASSLRLNKLMNNEVPVIVTDVKDAMTDLKTFSGKLSNIDLALTIDKVNTTLDNVNRFTAQLNSTDGTIGLLMNDKQLYNNINQTVADADKLVIDLREHPKRYVHFSLFGKKEK